MLSVVCVLQDGQRRRSRASAAEALRQPCAVLTGQRRWVLVMGFEDVCS